MTGVQTCALPICIQYRFRRNEADHSVCEIINPGHYKQFTERMGSFYRAYAPDTDYPEIRQIAEQEETEQPAEDEPEKQQATGEWQEPSLLPEQDHKPARHGRAQAKR